ncbi:MAG: EAL domain-containing protein [Oscillospiraceae bacterium]
MLPQKQILIVEDNLLNREMLKEILAGQYSVLEASNGQEALNILKQCADSLALILLDVMMPVMDGFSFLDKIKADPELALIPVIVMTQSDGEEDEVTALAHGATDFVPKPYRPQVILHRVASIINLRETAAMVNQFQYDRLTGLYSKEFFCQKVRERLLEDPEQDYCIVCSNIENFKLVNDIFGAQAGDSLLKEVAGIAQDMVGSTGFCGRFSADHFLCLQSREQEQQDRQNFGRFGTREFSPLLRRVVMRWGIYEITDRSIPVEQMCDRALLAANSIKGQYNQFFAVYDDSLRNRLLREKTITDSMETALTEGQFEVYLQPKYSLSDDCLAGAEALVRWNHPEWGFMPPGEFIPLFEKNGFIHRLDQYVWERACALFQDWREKGYPPLPVSVNVSRADIYQMNLVDTLLGLTQEYGVNPAYLHLEITESAYADSPSQIVSTVDQLRKLGFTIEMDDFGSGYSSLNMLSQMKLDMLKLDMNFIRNETAKSPEKSILNDVINMAHRMHLSVVAEGVETLDQVKRLQAVNCDYVQGYFFSKPLPVAEFEELFESLISRCAVSSSKTPRYEAGMRRLLVVDEDGEYREKARRALEDRYQVLEASDAQSAYACITEHGNNGISVVVLSMTIPEDGAVSLVKALRRDPAFWRIPVLATIPSAETMEKLPLALETDDFLCKRHPMLDLRRRVERLVNIVVSRERETALQDEAGRDYLTGLLNRRGFQAAMTFLRKEDLPLAVCLFDLDDLKKVNDTHGHDTGDRMICTFADLLRRKTRAEDILCRYGGDEFVVVLKRLDDTETVMKKAADICRAFHDLLAGEHLQASCSVGVALCGVDETPSAELIEHADRALYRAKRENKGGCSLWEAQNTAIS